MGAKNHAVILPDAHPEATVAALTGAAFGAAGQRCARSLSSSIPICIPSRLKLVAAVSSGMHF